MKKIHINEAFDKFITSVIAKGRSPRTVQGYKEFIQPFLNWAKLKYTTQLDFDLIQKYVVALRSKFSNPVTINTHLRAVRVFCYYCCNNNYTIPFKIALVSEPKNIKVPYDYETVKALVLNRDLNQQSISILLLIATGIRARTLCGLKVCDVDLYSKTLMLRELKNNTQSVLPLPDYVCKRVKRYIKEYNLQPDGYLFFKRNGEPHNSHSLWGMVTRYLKRKGYDSKGVHRFRHTFAKMTAEEDINSILLSRWLTHTDIKQSERYVNLYGSALRKSLKYTPVETILERERNKPE